MIKYFIMLDHPNGYPLPVIDDDENTMLWDTEKDASEWAYESDFAQSFGYEIFPWTCNE